MSVKNRLDKIEQQAAPLPPTPEQILARTAGLRAEDLSDEELTLVIRAYGFEPANGVEFTDEELAELVRSEKEA